MKKQLFHQVGKVRIAPFLRCVLMINNRLIICAWLVFLSIIFSPTWSILLSRSFKRRSKVECIPAVPSSCRHVTLDLRGRFKHGYAGEDFSTPDEGFLPLHVSIWSVVVVSCPGADPALNTAHRHGNNRPFESCLIYSNAGSILKIPHCISMAKATKG